MAALDAVTRWVDAYVAAWNTNAENDIRALFTDDAEYRTDPYSEPWRGAAAIVEGWLKHRDQPGETTFHWEPLDLTGDRAFVTGTTTYPDETYSNLWIIELAADGRCRSFTEWWMQHPDPPA